MPDSPKEPLDIIVQLVQVATLIALIVYVIKTWQMAAATRASAEMAGKTLEEMREGRDQEIAPYVVAYFDVRLHVPLIYLVIKNVGKTIATGVTIQFTPPLQSGTFKEINDIALLKQGIGSLPPGYEISTIVDTSISYFNDANLPLSYTAKVSYCGGLRTDQRVIDQVLDLAPYKGLRYTREDGLPEIAKQLDELNDVYRKAAAAMERMADRLNEGIYVKNPDFTVVLPPMGRDSWAPYVSGKLREFALYLTTYCSDQAELDIASVQARSLLIAQQMLPLIASDPCSKEAADGMARLAQQFIELGRMRIYIDAGRSHNAFWELGKKIVTDIGTLLHTIEIDGRSSRGSNGADDTEVSIEPPMDRTDP